MRLSLLGLIGFRLGILILLIVGVVGEGFGQRVYATNYGKKESKSIPLVQAQGRVNNPDRAIGNTVSFSELKINVGLLGGAYAHLQLKFINSNFMNLPAGTPIYVRLDNGENAGLLGLGLLLASKGLVSAYKNADSGNEDAITGTSVPILISEKTEEGSYYLIITPQDCFNSIEISIKSAGLLDLLSNGIIRVYHAYYECPEIQLTPVEPICHSESAILQIKDPFSITCGQEYLWYEQATGGSALPNAGLISAQYTTTPLTATKTSTQKTYWVEYTGVDNSICGRTPVTVTIHPKPSKIHIEAY